MKIAFLNKYQGKVNRGAETYVSELSKRLSNNFDVDVISDVNYLEILRRKYDVIVPTNGRLQVFLIRLISWVTGAKMVVSGQSGLGADDKWNLLCFPDVFVALTTAQEKWAKKFSSKIKMVVIPNGVDLIIMSFNSKIRAANFGLEHPIILNVGALVPNKRQDLIIKAVSKLSSVNLVLVGKGEMEKELRELGSRLIPGRLKILNFSPSEMAGVYKACDLFTFPTVPYESFGIVLVEAMASGLPVVANDDPIRKEIVGNAGFFVDPNDTAKYAETLDKALKVKWGNKPRKQAERFSWDIISMKYKELFESLV